MATRSEAPDDEGHLTARDGTRLYWRSWQPGGEPVGALAVVHGYGEHGCRYGSLIDALLPAGFTVHAVDHRGHGRSGGRRGHIRRWADYRDDVTDWLEMVGGREAGRPLFLLGHSMGALITLDYLIERGSGDLYGAVLSGPPLRPANRSGPVALAVLGLLSRLWPTLPMNVGLDPHGLAHDETVVEVYEADPLGLHGRATPRWGTEFMNAVRRVNEAAGRIDLPVLFVHGEDDPICLPAGTRAFFERLRVRDRTLRVYPGSRHEPHNDVRHEQVSADIRQWLEARLPA